MDARIRVLIVGQGAPSRGGIPTFVSSLLADPWLAERARLQNLNTTPARMKRPGAADAGNVRDALAHAWAVFRGSRRSDIVHLNLSPVPVLPLLRALLLSVAAKAGGSRVILHAHTGLLADAARRRPYRPLLRVALGVVDALVVVSREAEDTVRSLGRPVARIENGVPVERFRAGPKSEPPILAFVGTVCERKGLIDLRDALRSLNQGGEGPRLRVRIVGDGAQEDPGAFDRITAAFAEAGLDEVEFTGALGPEAVAGELAAASIFCLPSHWEGFPLSVLEGMASGAAVIATRVGDLPFILDEGMAGVLVPPKDSAALARAIDRLLRHPEERRRLGEAARRRAARAYGHDRVARAVFALYRRLAAAALESGAASSAERVAR